MRLNELEYDKSSQDDAISSLKKLLDQSGNCIMNGYLGEDINNFYFDTIGNLNFITDVQKEESKIHSHGVVLSDSILIKQVQEKYHNKTDHLYSWDLDQGVYTFLSFDNEDELNRYFDTIKRFDSNLCDDDISLKFQDMGLSFESVQRILINQSIDPFSGMFDDEFSMNEKEKSFVL